LFQNQKRNSFSSWGGGKHPAWYCMVYGLGRWLGKPNLLKNVLAKLEKERKK
jgi:hypothetical protein